ncbi:MAG TPA: hypothetical protein ENH35_05430, partial [Candidatus Moranbacteria bacterium]|nr:hypothetical protein [Candidatus Moranbacteria bacterium]
MNYGRNKKIAMDGIRERGARIYSRKSFDCQNKSSESRAFGKKLNIFRAKLFSANYPNLRLLDLKIRLRIRIRRFIRNNWLRKATIVFIILILISSIFTQNTPILQSATYTFVQTDWDGTPTGTGASHPGDQTGFTDYTSKDANISLTGGSDPYNNITLSSTADSDTQTTDADFGGTNTNTTVEGTGNGARIKLDDGYVYPTGVTVEESTIQEASCGATPDCYNSLFAWEADKQEDLVASNKIAVAKITGSWTSADTTTVTIDGWTTGPDNYIRIYTDTSARHNGSWDTSAYRLETNNNDGIRVNEDFVRIDGLQIKLISVNDDGEYGLRFQTASAGSNAYYEASNNVIRANITGTGISNQGIRVSDADIQTINIWNNIIYDFKKDTGVGNNSSIVINYVGTANIYNNTFYNAERG